jgi:hypothetical protein
VRRPAFEGGPDPADSTPVGTRLAAACMKLVETPLPHAGGASPHPTAPTIGGFSHGPGTIPRPAWSSCSRRDPEEGSWNDPTDTSLHLEDPSRRLDGRLVPVGSVQGVPRGLGPFRPLQELRRSGPAAPGGVLAPVQTVQTNLVAATELGGMRRLPSRSSGPEPGADALELLDGVHPHDWAAGRGRTLELRTLINEARSALAEGRSRAT